MVATLVLVVLRDELGLGMMGRLQVGSRRRHGRCVDREAKEQAHSTGPRRRRERVAEGELLAQGGNASIWSRRDPDSRRDTQPTALASGGGVEIGYGRAGGESEMSDGARVNEDDRTDEMSRGTNVEIKSNGERGTMASSRTAFHFRGGGLGVCPDARPSAPAPWCTVAVGNDAVPNGWCLAAPRSESW